MRNLQKYILISLCLFTSIISFGQQTEQLTEAQKRERVEKQTKPFKIDYFTKDTNVFYVLEASIDKGKIVINDNATIKEVSGKLPYATGDFEIEMINNQGEIIGRHFIENPLIIRSCDEKSSTVTTINKGTVFIPFIKSNLIATLVFKKNKERIGQVDISNVAINKN